ncbi:MAG: chromate transporter [Bryobacteraceae bacterium]
MNVLLLYLLLLKATITTFSGLASLPVLREDLVINRHVLTDEQLNTAIVVTRTTPGPVGLYIVSVGYFVAGMPGAIAGWLAMCTPALIIIPLVYFAGRRAEHPRAKSVIQAVVLSSAGLLWAATLPIARTAITDPVTLVIAASSVGILLTRKIESLWVILGASAVQLTAAAFRLVPGL